MRTLQEVQERLRDNADLLRAQQAQNEDRIDTLLAEIDRLREENSRYQQSLEALEEAVSVLAPSNVSPLRREDQVSRPKVASQGPVKTRKGGPTLTGRMITVMAGKTCRVDDIVDRLVERGWAPKSNNLKAYIGAHLSKSEEFVNVSRGLWAALGDNVVQAEALEEESEEPPKTETRPTLTESSPPSGELPSLNRRLAIILEDREMKISEIRKDLEDRGWAPQSKNLNTYLCMVLKTNDALFESVTRGVYRVTPAVREHGVEEVLARTKKPKAAKIKPTKVKPLIPSGKKIPTQEEVDEALKSFDTTGDIVSNPFG